MMKRTQPNISAKELDILWVSLDKKPVYSDKILTPALKWKFIGLVWIMIIFVTMVYGPIAAFLVELFPTKIRYTSMSLPYHIGNGVFGGLVPFIATLITTIPGSTPLSGLWYPIIVAILCVIIGSLSLLNKLDEDITDCQQLNEIMYQFKRIAGIIWIMVGIASIA